ncbi:MAG: sigma-70 family RNA polymerase sigma factor, partial [Verrucomicrobiota bacterium]
LKAWKGLKGFRGDAPFEHWLMRLAVRVCYDFLRRNRRHRENEISKEALDESGDRLTEEPEGNRELAADEAREVLHHAMGRLKEKDQLVLNLKELQHKSIREIAELTGWSESNVKVRAMRARNRLKDILIELGYAE